MRRRDALKIDKLVFETLDRIEVDVDIDGNPYVLREADTEASNRYRTRVARATKFAGGEVAAWEGTADAEPHLVSDCLFSITDKGGRQQFAKVPLSIILGWPPTVTTELFTIARKISGLEPKPEREVLLKQKKAIEDALARLDAEDPAKNSRNGSTAASNSLPEPAKASTPFSEVAVDAAR